MICNFPRSQTSCSTDEQAFDLAVSTAVNTYGGVDGLVLNAGTLDPLCRIGDDTPLSAWKKHFDVNFFSLVTAMKVTLPHLRKSPGRGKIIFVSSGAAVGNTVGWGPYNAGKAAMNSLCRCIPSFSSVHVLLRP
jgi:NAD(P)-dependent dehydrogenase (short-subunit alcohol dehydrogenase family)